MTQYTQDYVGGIEYRNGVLEAIYHAEGRITNINSTLKYEYALKDHLGNTRIMFCDKDGNGVISSSNTPESSEITQGNHFYPFGLGMEGTWLNTPSVSDSKYQYNGKELNDDFGLGLSDYGARFYDAAIGQWTTFDPLAEKMRRYSPYNYVLDNPMRFIDPDGRQATGYITGDNGNKLYYHKDIKSQEAVDKTYGKNSGLKYEGEDVVLKNSETGDRMYGDKDGQLSVMPKEDALVTAYKPTLYDKCSVCPTTIDIGQSNTSSVGMGGQAGYDLYWVLKGKDKSFFPYIVGNYGAGAGYNADIDLHGGLGWTSGNDIDGITADGLFNTSWNYNNINPLTADDGRGGTISVSASMVAELGGNYSYSKVSSKTGYHNFTISGGIAGTPGVNVYIGRYGSANQGRLDKIITNSLKKK